MKGRRLSITTRFVLVFVVLLLLASCSLGFVVLNQSKDTMASLINKNMIDVVKSAAGSLDGDVLGSLTADDVDGPAFRDIEDKLLVFQNSVDIHFIYAVKQVGDDEFVFTVDPDPVDPGDFGEEVLTTPALVLASQGQPAVGANAAKDRWGNFYSAYCPVYDSAGNIAGIVGIDFDATWYDQQVREHTQSIAIITACSVLSGAIAVGLITSNMRKRFRDLDRGLSALSNDVDRLMAEMASYSDHDMREQKVDIVDDKQSADELEVLGNKIHTMREEMSIYLDYLHMQAYTDALTRIGNSTAYHDTVRELNEMIEEGTADFWVAVYDVNSLKELNDTYGHEQGDRYIIAAAQVIMRGFADAQTYRVGGDEFAVIAKDYDQERMDESLRMVAEKLDMFNEEERPCEAKLYLSRGWSCFRAGQDESFKDVFKRADQAMYADKREFYRTIGDRRERR